MVDYKEIKKHWDSLADTSDSYKASWEDFYMVEKEIIEICKHIQGNEEICDVGCNNGYCDFKLLALFNGIKIVGIDYSEKLISQARKSLAKAEHKNRVEFIIGDILDPSTFPKKKFDIVLIKRVLVNLNTDNDQMQALINVKKLLNEHGKIILAEPVEENLNKLNKLRNEFNLDGLVQPWHNLYLNKTVIDSLYSRFNVECDDDYCSSYYIFSRVFHPWVKKINGDLNT